MVVALANFNDVIGIAFPILDMIIILRIYSPAEFKKNVCLISSGNTFTS